MISRSRTYIRLLHERAPQCPQSQCSPESHKNTNYYTEYSSQPHTTANSAGSTTPSRASTQLCTPSKRIRRGHRCSLTTGTSSSRSSVGILVKFNSNAVAHFHLRPPQPVPPTPTHDVPPSTDQFAQILRLLTESQEAAACERQRRIQWEKEQEARYSQRDAEIQEKFSSMQERITELTELVNTSRAPTTASEVSTPASFNGPTFPTLEQPYIPPETPFSPAAHSPYAPSPTFVQGSSRQPYMVHPLAMSMPATPVAAFSPVPIMTHATSTPLPHTPHIPAPQIPLSILPHLHLHPHPFTDMSTSPTASFPATPANHPSAASPPSGTQPNPRKRPATTDDDEDNSSERPRSPRDGKPAKRVNGHDNRCLTIHVSRPFGFRFLLQQLMCRSRLLCAPSSFEAWL